MFVFLIAFSAAALACAAGFFSIYGLSQIYAASAVSVIIMGASLEFAKLITASFLYRFWNKIRLPLKSYLLVALGILMTITSIGIFGYLTAAYQKDNIPVSEISQKISMDKDELQRTIDRKNQIDQQIAKLPNNYVKSRKQLIASFASEYNNLQPNIDRLTKEISDLQSKQLVIESKVGPIMYVAKVLNKNPDDAIFYLTIIIVIVFDPLAVALTIATNIAIENKTKSKDNPSIPEEKKPFFGEKRNKDDVLEKIRTEIAQSNN